MSKATIVYPVVNRAEAFADGPMPQHFEILLSERPEFAGDSVKVSAAFAERTVLIDLTAVTWVDSWGLALFIEASQQIKAHGGTLVFVGVHDSLQRLLATTKIDQLLHIASSRDEALGDANTSC